jgi:hypothetical protein
MRWPTSTRLPFPARHLLDNGLYHFPGVPGLVDCHSLLARLPDRVPVLPLRVREGSALRQRSPENVVEENAARTSHLRHRYLCLFAIRSFTLRNARAREICSGWELWSDR